MRYCVIIFYGWLGLAASACLDPERIELAKNQDASAPEYVPGCRTCLSAEANPACRDLVERCHGYVPCAEGLECVIASCVGSEFQSFLSCVNVCAKESGLLGPAASEYGIGLYQCLSGTCRAQCIADNSTDASPLSQ
jgi:hypothetical protein